MPRARSIEGAADIGDAPVTLHFTTVSGPPPPIWPGFVMAAAVLLAAVVLAWWRRRAPVSPRPRRRTRIIVAGAAGGGGGALVKMAAPGTIGGTGWGPYAPSPWMDLFVHFLTYWLFAILLVGTTDLLFDVLRPCRNRTWLFVGAPLFAAFIIAILRATGWIDPLVIPPTRDQAIVAVAALAAGLTWWSWLPASWEPIAHVFE
jgi:MYXO-CTERM domain-containing protein